MWGAEHCECSSPEVVVVVAAGEAMTGGSWQGSPATTKYLQCARVSGSSDSGSTIFVNAQAEIQGLGPNRAGPARVSRNSDSINRRGLWAL